MTTDLKQFNEPTEGENSSLGHGFLQRNVEIHHCPHQVADVVRIHQTLPSVKHINTIHAYIDISIVHVICIVTYIDLFSSCHGVGVRWGGGSKEKRLLKDLHCNQQQHM